MENNCKIAETGLIGMLREMNNQITSIKLCMELLEAGDQEFKEAYYEIIKKNTDTMESVIRQICNSFTDEGFTVHLRVKDKLVKEL